MNKKTTRRGFISDSTKTVIAITAGMAAGNSALASVKDFTSPHNKLVTGFTQDPLPYSYNSLEKSVDAQTMEIHYSKHASAYASNLRDAAVAEKVDMTRPLEDVLSGISKYSIKLRNNGGGHYNHELFWKTMSPTGGGNPTGKLQVALEKSFNSIEAFKTQFADAGKSRFGSGWAWLFLDKEKNLMIGSTPNQDNPLMDVSDIKGVPLLGLDVWEHAYYLRYQNKRADYINAWWNVVNWNFVQQRYESLQ